MTSRLAVAFSPDHSLTLPEVVEAERDLPISDLAQTAAKHHGKLMMRAKLRAELRALLPLR